MDVKLKDVVVKTAAFKSDPSEDTLRQLRAQAETEFRYNKHVDEDTLVFTSQLVTEVAPTYHQVETFIGLPA